MTRIVELLLNTAKARASYSTRVWTALFLPLVIGSLLGLSIRIKIENLLVSTGVVLVYSVAHFSEKKFLR